MTTTTVVAAAPFAAHLRRADSTPAATAETAVSESERRLRALVGSLDEIVFEFDAQGTYLDVWAKDESLLADPAGSLPGRTIADVLGEEEARPFLERIERVLATGAPEVVEYRLEVAAGARWFLGSLNRVPPPEGGRATVAMITRDITSRKSLEEQLCQSQKLEAIGRLAGGVAHDFNNLLTVILGHTETILERDPDLDDPRVVRRQVEEVQAAAERAAALTRQLLAFSRRQVLEPRVLDLNAVVADTESMLLRTLGEDVELRTALAPGLGLVRVDPGQIGQVLLNLAVNARDAMPRGGSLTIETCAVDAPAEADGGAPGGWVRVSVIDTGEGMEAGVAERAFEPFFTTKGPGKGTGLGLSTVLGIVEQSGGRIRVTSEPGRGTRFDVDLPCVEELVRPATPEPARAPAARGHGTILLVEDAADLRGLVRAILQRLDYDVLEAASAEEALRLTAGTDGAIDLLLTDVVMPRIGGTELARRLAEARPGLKVLFMSGYADDTLVTDGAGTPGQAFLAKPFTPRVLAAKLREVLDDGTLH